MTQQKVIKYCPSESKSNESMGVLFFNLGNRCMLRAFVAMYTLRKYYAGEAAIMLSEDDEFSNVVIDNLKPFNITPHFYKPVVKCRKNTGYTIKPDVLRQSPFYTTIYSDTDVIFKADPSVIFNTVKENKLVLTRYRDWVTTGRGMSKRIKSLSDMLPPEQIQAALDYGTAINTGVVGYQASEIKDFFDDWVKTTLKGEGRFIIDELVCQCICYKYEHAILEAAWNYSCREKDFTNSKIIHFHGRKHARPERFASGKLWLEQYDELKKSKIIPKETMNKLIQWDRQVKKYEASTKKLVTIEKWYPSPVKEL